MSEKLHNNDYDATNVSGTAANSNDLKAGNSNKIKLKATTYAIVMEVQEAFMQEELEKQNKELDKLEANATNPALTEEQKTIINENIESLRTQIKSLTKVYEEFSNAHQKFMEVAKKALKVHEDNIEQMKKSVFYTEGYEPEMSVDFSDYEKAQTVLEDAQNANIFSNVDSEAIKEEVNRVMAEKDSNALSDEDKDYENNGNYFAQNVTSDNFERVVSTAAKEINEELKEQEPEKMSKDDIKADLDKFLGGTTPINTDNKDEKIKSGPLDTGANTEETRTPSENNESIFDQEQPIEPEYDMSNPNHSNSEMERRYTILGKTQNNTQGVDFNGDTDFQQFLTSRQEGLNERSKAVSSLRTEVDTLEQTKKEKEERLAEATKRKEQDDADIASMAEQLKELKRLDEEENRLSSEETNPIFDQEQPIEPEYDELGVDFNSDKSIESFIKGLEDRNASLKSHGEELNSKISEVKAERTEATNKQEQAKREREEAKKRKDKVKRQIELFNSYKPKMDELRKANEEQEKLNSDKEAELKKENEALAAINSETTTIETETAAYDEETSKALEELKKLRAEFAGTGYDSGDTQMTSGGRTM